MLIASSALTLTQGAARTALTLVEERIPGVSRAP